jgi:heme/copper-type cytochrome/quinol oxidase subunit 3
LPRTYDAAALPSYSISNHAPLFVGQVLLAAIEGTMFLNLIAMYAYIRLSVDVWPPPGIRFPELTMSSLALIPLILSAGGSYWASEGAKKDDRFAMLVGLIANLVLGAIFVLMEGASWRSFNFTWASDIHGSIVWALLFLFIVDAVADLCFTTSLVIAVARGHSGPRQRLGVHVDSVVWYFIVLIWLPLYAVIYWGPRILGGGQ